MKRKPPLRVSRYTAAKRGPLAKKKPGKRRTAAIGIDIGGTKTLAALLDDSFEVVAEEKLRTVPEKGGFQAFDRALGKAVKALMREAGKRGLKVKYAGVGCAGRIDMRR